jgi:glutathione synthase/RimK-type ligase-like ATP-grasp enzyme
MTRVLIASYPDDVHAYEVALALADLGHHPQIWHGADFPTRQTASLRFDGPHLHWSAKGPELDLDHQDFDTVWYRRPTAPVLPDDLDPADRPVAQRECEDFVEGLWHLLAPDAMWVNSLASRRRSNLKSVQLLEATRSGLAIPPTLMSNDPPSIRAFVEAADHAIYKPFYPAHWESGEQVAVLLTTEIRTQDLPDDDVLRLTPGIFQHRIDKAHELRVTYLGGELVAAKLRSQEAEITRLDWRASAAALPVEAIELPDSTQRACRELMRRLGLVFGCIDFIVTPDDRTVFLEVNPMGQFLWVEDACPSLNLLDAFCSFLASGREEFRYRPGARVVRHDEYYDRAVRVLEATRSRHETAIETFVSRDRPDSFARGGISDRVTKAPG